ncbi:MAG: ATP-dependent DNA helicase RecG [Gemmatimonadota bacterium]
MTTHRAASPGRVSLEMPVKFLKGVGDRRSELLNRLGIATAGDLLYHVPHRYEDASTITPINRIAPGMDVTALGRVISKGVLPTRKGLKVFQAVVRDSSGMIEVGWPGQVWLDRVIQKGDLLLLSGPCRFYHGRQLQPREWVNFGGDEDVDGDHGRVLAVYPATEGFTPRQIRALIAQHLDVLLPLVREYLDDGLLRRAGQAPLGEALRMMHRPASMAEAMTGRNRLAFDELFFAHILHRRANAIARRTREGIRFVKDDKLQAALRSVLPWKLTGAQERAVVEITDDMCSPRRMHRLLQGDVGSGKTVVALFAALLAIENDFQVALMAPTELLAEQHQRTITALLAPVGVRCELITGSTGAARRREVEARLASQEPLLVIGTHVLIQEKATLGKPGLVIIDEQQRFGVGHRAAIAAGGGEPDVLLMSATPIPRSLALTIYGDLDVSTLDERPPGRRPVTTAVRPESARARVITFIDQQVEKGQQAYIVYPVIDESEKTDLKAATRMYEELSSGPFAKRKVALLHGRIPAAERDRVMREFRDGVIDILIATTVIEVGIDVPAATVMVVEHPERFGLSQLHQLRGRVGRGGDASYCILLGDASPEASERLQLFAGTDDGFEIARADLRLRGMGDLFGERQSGLASFKVADPLRDEAINITAREMAWGVLEGDPELKLPKNAGIRDVLASRYSRALELFRVG